MNYFKKWQTYHKVWFFGLLLVFWFWGWVFAYQNGNKPNLPTDGTTEGMTMHAGLYYLEHGFFSHHLLPMYPAFGHAPDGKLRTEPFVYNHYLAGQDLIMGLVLKIFGQNQMWIVRMVPHSLTVLAMAAIAYQFGALLGVPLLACLFLSLLFIPRSLVAWSICWYGHSYVLAFLLLAVAGLLYFVNRKRQAQPPKFFLGLLGFSIGILQMFFDLDWVPLTFISCLAFCILLADDITWSEAIKFLTAMVVGGLVAAGYQLLISALEFGSLKWVVENLIQWLNFRAGVDHVNGITPMEAQMKWNKILQEYNRQAYGATGFTGANLVVLSLVFSVLGLGGRVLSQKAFLRAIAFIVLSWLAAAFWNLTMRQHSSAHLHFLPRHYFSLYLSFCFLAVLIAYHLIMRSRKITKNQKLTSI